MSTSENRGANIPTETDAYYEMVASQEEIYLEETEEELRAILVFDDLSPSPSGLVLAESCIERELHLEIERPIGDSSQGPRIGEGGDEQLDLAAEELITGDSDDPPLSEEAVAEMMRNNTGTQRPGGM